jgi:hypothetical protein
MTALQRDLPPECRTVDVVAYWSGSQGFKQGYRYRAVVLLDRPIPDTALRAWIQQVNAARAVDGGVQLDDRLCLSTQLHYVAAPLFSGVTDPLPGARLWLFKGKSRRAVLPLSIEKDTDVGRTGRRASGSSAASAISGGGSTLRARGGGGNGDAFSWRVNRHLMSIERGDDHYHVACCKALECWFWENGGEVDPQPILDRIWHLLNRHALTRRGRDYVEREFAGFCAYAEVLQDRERAAAAAKRQASNDTVNKECGREAAR